MRVVDLGRTPYQVAWGLQKALWAEVDAGGEDVLAMVEHDPVVTLGASFHESNLRVPRERFAELGIDLLVTDRGGDVTFHGPGQLVAYPIFDVRRHGADLHRWLRDIEEAVIRALGSFGLSGERLAPHTGVWLRDGNDLAKVAAIGVKLRRWISMHGVAVNVNNDLEPFRLIVPCGIEDRPVTSVALALGRPVSQGDFQRAVEAGFRDVFS